MLDRAAIERDLGDSKYCTVMNRLEIYIQRNILTEVPIRVRYMRALCCMCRQVLRPEVGY